MIALACPMIDAAGQPAGFASNCAAVHAFCSVVRREGSCLGSSTLTLLMFAWVPSAPATVSLAVRLAPSARLVLALVETVRSGLNARLEQSAASNGVLTVTGTWSAGLAGLAPAPSIVSVIDRGLQLVGLRMNSLRSM